MKLYILDAPLTPPKDTSDAPERLAALIKACSEIIADGQITAEEAAALRRWLQAAGWLKKFWPVHAIAARINRLLEPLRHLNNLTILAIFSRRSPTPRRSRILTNTATRIVPNDHKYSTSQFRKSYFLVGNSA
jgi:hypothetical protein